MTPTLGLLCALSLAACVACSNTEAREVPSDFVEGELGLADVSILFPLPESGHLDDLLTPNSQGRFGPLLPADVADELPSASGDWRVVSARLDPCFPSLVGAPTPDCRFQLRLVMQPLEADGNEVRAQDAARHLFYDLPVSDFIVLTRALVAARPAPAPGALTVQPELVEGTLDGAYADALRTALLDGAGATRLSRVTFMSTNLSGQSFTFGGVDVRDGVTEPISIAGASVSEQSFVTEPTEAPEALSAQVVPKLAGAQDDLSPLYDSKVAASLDDVALWSLYEAALRVENPEHRSSANVDCVSCHSASPLRRGLEVGRDFASRPSALRYGSPFDLTVLHPPEDARSLRAFGWRGTQPVVSARVINESAAVASYLNRQLMR